MISVGLAFWSVMTTLSGTAKTFGGLLAFRIGVGMGEASATPAALSMLSDYFGPKRRATVMAIYSSGLYIGGGIGLAIGGIVLDTWHRWFPDHNVGALRAARLANGLFIGGCSGNSDGFVGQDTARADSRHERRIKRNSPSLIRSGWSVGNRWVCCPD